MADLKLSRLTKKFGKVTAVNDLTLEMPDGELLVILGPSGAGKSTTLKLIAGVEQPTSGSITLGGKVINALEPQQRNVSMTFETYALYPHLTVYDNIAFPLRAPSLKLSTTQIDKRVREVAEMLNIQMLLDRQPYQLSGGQKQRTALGRTMVRQPALFLLDEPLSHLDAKLRHRMRAEFKHLRQSIRTTMIYVTHDYLEALALGDRIAVLKSGVLQQMGTADEIFNRPINTFVAQTLGHPEINIFDTNVVQQDDRLLLRTADSQVKLALTPQLARQVASRNLSTLKVGIRPMHLSLSDAPANGQDSIRGQVYVFEHVGTKGVLTVKVGDRLLSALTPSTLDMPRDTTVQLAVAPEQLMVFDPQTTRNLIYAR